MEKVAAIFPERSEVSSLFFSHSFKSIQYYFKIITTPYLANLIKIN